MQAAERLAEKSRKANIIKSLTSIGGTSSLTLHRQLQLIRANPEVHTHFIPELAPHDAVTTATPISTISCLSTLSR